MHRHNIFLPDIQIDFLKFMGGITVAEHIRRAIDEYIEREKQRRSPTSKSPSVTTHQPI